MAGRSQTSGRHTGMILIQTRKPEKKITEQEKRRQGRLKKIKILKKKIQICTKMSLQGRTESVGQELSNLSRKDTGQVNTLG